MPNVLIAPAPLRHQPGPFRDLLVAAGFTPIDPEGDNTLSEAQLRRVLPDADAMLAGGEVLSASVLEDAPRLRAIARTGVGYDAVDLSDACRRGIAVTITPGTNQGSVAEQTFALLLAVARNVAGNDRTIREGGWDRTLVRPIRGSTLGLLGLGRIGRAVATRARAFEMNVIAFDPLPAGAFEAEHGIERADLETVLTRSDILSLHLPLTPATQGLIHRGTLARMKPGAILLNTARGGLIVEPDLYEALVSGHLAGAGLDVLQDEPPRPGNPLLALPNVVFSPHIGGIDARHGGHGPDGRPVRRLTLSRRVAGRLRRQRRAEAHLGLGSGLPVRNHTARPAIVGTTAGVPREVGSHRGVERGLRQAD